MSSKSLMVFALLAIAICGASCAVVMAEESDAADTYTATFVAGTGGTVSASSQAVPAGASYSASGSMLTIYKGSFNFGVQATANSGYTFTGWSPSSGTINSNTTFTANFAEAPCRVSFVASPSYGGSITQSYIDVPSGTTFDTIAHIFRINGSLIYANAAADYEFSSWSPSRGTITSNTTVTAYFENVPSTVTARFTAGTGGSVSTSSHTVPYGADYYVSGNLLVISLGSFNLGVQANPDAGYAFSSWSPSSGTITSNTTFTASFAPSTTSHAVTFVAGQGGSVSTSSYTVPNGAEYMVSDNRLIITKGSFNLGVDATPNTGYVFDSWSPSSGTVTSNMTFTASFAPSTTTHSVTFVAGTGGTVSTGSFAVPDGAEYMVSDNRLIITKGSFNLGVDATPNTGYVFDSWSPSSGTVTSNMTFTASFVQEYPTHILTFTAGEGGSVSASSQEVPDGAEYMVSGNRLIISKGSFNFGVDATPNTGYVFESWSPSSGTITSDMTFTASFYERFIDPNIYWTNDNYNGRIDIIFGFDGNGSQTISGDLYTGSSSAGVANWSFTSFTVKTFVEKSGTITRVGAQILQGETVVKTNATGGSWPNVGSWDALQVSIDPEHAQVVFTPVSVLNSFTDYKLYDTQARTMLSWGEVLESSAIRTLQHEASGDAPRFSVVGTRVFLDTYNAVLFDPRINVREKFPQYDSVRLNFYSFALYGDSMTVNGYTYPVTGDKITITYVDQDGTHYAVGAVEGGEERTRNFTLTNIYVSWDALTGHATLTFVGDRWTMDLGTYSDQVVSFSGMWYFYTMLYNSHITQEKGLGDWKALPETNQSQMVLIYLGILAVAGVAGIIHLRHGGHATLDLIVIGCAGIVGYILLG